MKKGLKELLRESDALRYGSFKLASGATSSYYVDIKMASTDPKVLREMARALAGKMIDGGIECDRLAGVVLGAVPLVVALSLEREIPYLMIRRQGKSHGVGNVIEGPLMTGERVVVVEDVVTSARSVADAVETLRGEGASVTDVLAVVDRESGGTELLASMGISFHPLMTASDLLED